MAKKNFDNMNTGSVYSNTLTAATTGQSADKKKDHRINLVCDQETYSYIKTMSRVYQFDNMSDFVNAIIKKYMEQDREAYDVVIEHQNNF